MAHPIYRKTTGERVPSVTTVLRLLSIGGNEGLLYWANQLGLDGKTLEDARKTTMDVGTLAHMGVEADIKGEPFDIAALQLTDQQRRMVGSCITEWHRWKDRSRLVPVEAEVSLVSDKMGYGGTLDMVCNLDGRMSLLDIKTGNVYPEHICQVAAYGGLWEELRGQKIEEYHLLRLGKEDAAFHHHSWSADAEVIEVCQKLFVLTLTGYPLAQRAKKLAA